MKTYLITILLFVLTFAGTNAQILPTSTQVVQEILSVSEHRDELTRLKNGIVKLLADQRLTDQTVRGMLAESQASISEMLDQKSGANAGKLVDFAKWLRAQLQEKHVLEDAQNNLSISQQFVIDNPLAGGEVYLTSLLNSIFATYLEKDREAAGHVKLEAALQLYLSFRPVLERGWWRADDLLLYSPQWMQERYSQLTVEQKRSFLKDVNDARAEKALGPAADEEPLPPLSKQEQAAYEAAYLFILNNTP